MANRMGARQAANQIRPGKGVADMAHMALGVKPATVKAGYAAGFLTAMLQGVQAKGADGAGIGNLIDPKHTAFESWPIIIGFAMLLGGKRLVCLADHRFFSTRSSTPWRDVSS